MTCKNNGVSENEFLLPQHVLLIKAPASVYLISPRTIKPFLLLPYPFLHDPITTILPISNKYIQWSVNIYSANLF